MKKEHNWAFLIISITGFLFVILSGSIFSGYHFMDCSDYLKWERDLSEMSWLECLVKHINGESGIRFRPAWHLNALIKTLLFHDNMFLQHIWQILMNIIAAFLIYLFGRKIHWSFKESLLFAGLSLIGTQSAVFYQTMAIETPALIILFLSWHFLLKYYDKTGVTKIIFYLGFIVSSLFAALMKENFTLILPASYLFYCMQYNEKYQTGFFQSIFHTWKTGLLLLILTTGCLWAILTFAGNDFGYAGVNRSNNFLLYLKCMAYLCVISGCFLAIIMAIYLFCTKKTTQKEWLFPTLLFLTIILPQIVLYGKSNIIDRYLIPAIVGCAYFSVFVYRQLKKQDQPIHVFFWRKVCLILSIIILVSCSFIAFSEPFRKELVYFTVHLQGATVQKMTSVSNTQYLLTSLSIIAWGGMLIGCLSIILCLLKGNRFLRKLSHLYMSGLLLVLFISGILAFASCKRYAMRGFATEKLLKTIIDHTNSNDVILVAGNPLVDMEGMSSGIAEYLQKRDRKNLIVYPITKTPEEKDFIPFILDFYHQKDINTQEDKNAIKAIAVFPGWENLFKEANTWFEVNSYDYYVFEGNYVVYVKKQ